MKRTYGNVMVITIAALLMGLALPSAMANPRGYMMEDEEREDMMQERGESKYGYDRGHGYGQMGMGRGGMGHESRSLTGMLGPMFLLDLDDKQQAQLFEIKRGLRNSNWPLMGKQLDEKDRLHQLYAADELDAQAIEQSYGAIFELKKQMIGNVIKAQNEARKLLTPEQKEQYRDMQRGKMHGNQPGAGRMGSGMRGPGMME